MFYDNEAKREADIAYREAVINFRRLIALGNTSITDAMNMASINAGLGLNQIAEFEREVSEKYADQLKKEQIL